MKSMDYSYNENYKNLSEDMRNLLKNQPQLQIFLDKRPDQRGEKYINKNKIEFLKNQSDVVTFMRLIEE